MNNLNANFWLESVNSCSGADTF